MAESNEQTKKVLYDILGKLKLLVLIGITLLMIYVTINAIDFFYSCAFWSDYYHYRITAQATSAEPFSSEDILTLEEIENASISTSDNNRTLIIHTHGSPPATMVSGFAEKLEASFNNELVTIFQSIRPDGNYDLKKPTYESPRRSKKDFRLDLTVYLPFMIVLFFYGRYLFRLYKKIKAAPEGKRLAFITEIKSVKPATASVGVTQKSKSKSARKKSKKRR